MVDEIRLLGIADVARIYNVTFRTLRFYEDKGLLFPKRVGTGRFYSPKDCIRLQVILKGKRLGFTLSEISGLILRNFDTGQVEPSESDAARHLDGRKIAEQLDVLERQRRDVDKVLQELREALDRMTPKEAEKTMIEGASTNAAVA